MLHTVELVLLLLLMADLDVDRRRAPAEDDTYDLCSKCGEPIIGEAYASMGGNIVPYIPAKLYHIRCIPSVTELLGPKKEIQT